MSESQTQPFGQRVRTKEIEEIDRPRKGIYLPIAVNLIALTKARAIKLMIDDRIMGISLINLQTQLKFSWDFTPEVGWALPTLNPYRTHIY